MPRRKPSHRRDRSAAAALRRGDARVGAFTSPRAVGAQAQVFAAASGARRAATPMYRRLAPLLIVAAGFGVYANSFGGPFIFDDIDGIVENPHMRRLWPLSESLTAPARSCVAGRPVVAASLAVNYALGELNVWGYHAFNVGAHAAVGLALFGLLRRVVRRFSANDDRSFWIALCVALIWVVHPLNSDALNHMVYRTEVLMALFYVVTLYCVMRGAASDHRAGAWYVLAVVASALGMGSKENMASVPIAAFLLDRAVLSESFVAAVRRRWPLYAGLAATWLVIPLVRATRYATGLEIADLPVTSYLWTQCGVLVYYLRLSFWPHPLVLEYSNWPLAEGIGDAFVPAVVVFVLTVMVAACWRWKPAIGLAWIVGFFVLAPTSLIPNKGEIAAEHRMYLPLVAVIATVVALAYVLTGAAGRRLNLSRTVMVGGRFGVVAGVVLALGATTLARNRDYRSSLSIWQDVVEKWPIGHRGYHGVANALREEGKFAEAIPWYEKTLELEPHDLDAHNNLGALLQMMGRQDEAIEHFRYVLTYWPENAKTHNNLAMALMSRGDTEEAIAQYREAVRLQPTLARAQYNLGLALAQAGDLDEAKERFENALATKPDFAEMAHTMLGRVHLAQGDVPGAIDQFERALRIRPDYGEAQQHLARAREKLRASQGASD